MYKRKYCRAQKKFKNIIQSLTKMYKIETTKNLNLLMGKTEN